MNFNPPAKTKPVLLIVAELEISNPFLVGRQFEFTNFATLGERVERRAG
jgi:hypothetical protein